MTALLLALLLSAQCPMHEQHTQAAKSLPAETLTAYRNGTGMGMAMPAEMNGYPGPRHILDLGEQLHLTAGQRARIQTIYDAMHEEAVRLGNEIIDLETKLDHRFADSSMTPQGLQSLTAQIAERQGRLRYVHLRAHLAAKEVLTAEQVLNYMKLRQQ